MRQTRLDEFEELKEIVRILDSTRKQIKIMYEVFGKQYYPKGIQTTMDRWME